MAIILSLIVGVLSALNITFWANTILQVIVTLVSLISLFIYRGRRTVASYKNNGTRQFTFGFAFCWVIFFASASILLAFLLHLN
ncbi:MAG: hypothetical protein FWF42_03065 [Streptococcaceae bacterium]|nr:hypothetical protein [Streptococcaceae bacterium]MCL2681096.1 hypothetical protein [Streptococcaceae bacterium]MCL2858650.1 hypothetical protein [Streptococcaceae bacterium]